MKDKDRQPSSVVSVGANIDHDKYNWQEFDTKIKHSKKNRGINICLDLEKALLLTMSYDVFLSLFFFFLSYFSILGVRKARLVGAKKD